MNYTDSMLNVPKSGPEKLTRKGTYPLGDFLPFEVKKTIIEKHAPIAIKKAAGSMDRDKWVRDAVRLQWDGKPRRPVKAGEWYLSGSTIAGYTVNGDIPSAHYIANLVVVSEIVTTTTTIVAC